MKKRNLILSLLIVLASTTFAQLVYGPKIGGNTSKFTNAMMRPGFHAGGFVNAELFDRFGVQADFIWNIKGSATDVGNDSVSIIRTSYYRFIEVPICAYFPISKHIRGFVGPQLNFYRKGEATTEYKKSSVTEKLNGTGKMSWVAGFDFVFDSPITVGMRFGSNKFSTGTTSSEEGAEENVSRLNSFMLSFGYKLDW